MSCTRTATAKLICAFGFAYAYLWLSHEVAQTKDRHGDIRDSTTFFNGCNQVDTFVLFDFTATKILNSISPMDMCMFIYLFICIFLHLFI